MYPHLFESAVSKRGLNMSLPRQGSERSQDISNSPQIRNSRYHSLHPLSTLPLRTPPVLPVESLDTRGIALRIHIADVVLCSRLPVDCLAVTRFI
jgi:hypothetical protein